MAPLYSSDGHPDGARLRKELVIRYGKLWRRKRGGSEVRG